MELVGHETSAIFARSSSSAEAGWRRTIESPRASERANVRGATTRHVSQSMHESSTKKSPGAFSLRRAEIRATQTD